MREYNDLQTILGELETVQSNEKDERDEARNCQNFTTKKGGQWDEKVWQTWGQNARPRFQFDRVTPIIDLVVGELERNEFAATVIPANGAASKDNAEILDGMLRSIQNWSDAEHSYKRVARQLFVTGFDCLRVRTDYLDDESFNQDLIIDYIHNSIDRVWFDPNSERQDRKDANWCIQLQALEKHVYELEFPNGSGESVNSSTQFSYYRDGKREVVVVGEILYKKTAKRTLVLMSNGASYFKDEAQNVIDDLAAKGVQVVKERETDDVTVYSRKFDGGDWLEEEKETVFSILPVIPFYHCFQIIEDKITWRRAVQKMIDPQRVVNFAESRQLEEMALAPRRKIMMTREQAKGHEHQIKTLNTNADPVQFWNVDGNAPPPYEMGGAQINPALQQMSMNAANALEATAGMYGPMLAQNPGLQSGKAIELQQDKGDTGNSSFYVDIAKGITYLCEVLIDGIPKVYDANREILLMKADGSTDMQTLHNTIIDEQTGEVVTLNNLEGKYSVTCEMGAMFKNQAEKSNAALLELGKVSPQTLQTSMDIFTRNIAAPGMDAVSERVRDQLIKQGLIPEDQLTDEEKQKLMAQAQQQQEPSPDMVLAQAEMLKGQADMLAQQNKQAELQLRAQEIQLKGGKLQIEAKDSNVKEAQAIADIDNTNADTVKKLAEAEKTNSDTVTQQVNTLNEFSYPQQ